MPEYWNPEGGEFKMKGFPYPGKSPVKKHDGTTSTTTHYADGTPKSAREVEFSKRHEEELRKEKLLDQGFTPEDSDKMIKTGATTGEVDPDAPGTPGKPGYEPPVRRSDLDKKGKAIWDAHRAKKKSPAKDTKSTRTRDKKDLSMGAIRHNIKHSEGYWDDYHTRIRKKQVKEKKAETKESPAKK